MASRLHNGRPMTHLKTLTVCLLALALCAGPAHAVDREPLVRPAAKTRFITLPARWEAKRAARAELEAFLAEHPKAAAERKAQVGWKAIGARVAAAAVTPVPLLFAAFAAYSESGHNEPHLGSGALVLGAVALNVGAAKAARRFFRNANTAAVLTAMKDGAEVSQDQLHRWGDAGLIALETVRN